MRWIFALLLFILIVGLTGFWYFQNPSSLLITTAGYEIQLSLQLGVIILLALFFTFFFCLRLLAWIFCAPSRWAACLRGNGKDRLFELLSIYEAEDFKKAFAKQKKIKSTHSKDPYFLWISGNLYEKADQPFEAEQCYMELTKDPSTAFLGFKGQIRAAFHRHDLKTAEMLLKKAQAIFPHSPWVLRHLLALLREKKEFKNAEDLVLRLEEQGEITPENSKKQTALLYYQAAQKPSLPASERESFLRQSHYLDPSLQQTTLELVPLLKSEKHLSYALSALRATWDANPCQQIGDLYLKTSDPETPVEAYNLAKDLVKANASHPESLLLLARTALDAKLWGEARVHLKALIERDPTAEAYHLFAKLELLQKKDQDTAMEWLEKGLNAPRRV